MDRKKESPNNQAGRTGSKDTYKGTKRKRIKRYELIYKWQDITQERAAI